ncbi:hypothetical protein GUITHDRAFT_114918 [Guillardia theta CCMP2712]|uniref:Uncharacterized protein n=1 Tax=Guillardia theta (strain CCMP2712) TaxID=905079 RepID=L1IT71_GUITC|nr:hypothetical protein GUITHDRAFT_114918 [Guillardia theta CCMP2712]EKX39040.1 hypothetical protein GUITHDRAFT_114918 [Guillardia theta CCMP2712]|eukprot:XP_005826020.1 hypothetical protein GUITHDRAFT_114918 [Guillardia theta CCMP2712]
MAASIDHEIKGAPSDSVSCLKFAPSKPIKSVHWIQNQNLVVTGSWDKTLKYWDVNRVGTDAVATIGLNERVYSMDVNGNLAVVACADRNIHVFDLRNFSVPVKSHQSPLRHQIRTVALFNDNRGYAIGSIEGRVHIQHINDDDTKLNFAFKCHRDSSTQDIFAVNAIVFHKKYGTFCTAGSDGTFNFWDKDAKQRLKGFQRLPNSISSVDFNRDGTLFAYAQSYDWSRGPDSFKQAEERIFLHPVQENEIRPKSHS